MNMNLITLCVAVALAAVQHITAEETRTPGADEVKVELTPASAGKPVDFLAVVKAYADCMLEHGQDVYGPQHSPLFAEALDRHTLKILDEEFIKRSEPSRDIGMRPQDRMLRGANPQHCENLYQILYELTPITGDPKYAAAADASLRWFFENCQGPATGLLYWGEHAGWDFRSEKPLAGWAGNWHEEYRQWVLWDRSWTLAPEACRKFAVGLWEHQIADQQTGDFCRHGVIDKPKTYEKSAPYARHGGFYIFAWAKAYQKTKDPQFLRAIEVVLGGLENDMRRPGGMQNGAYRPEMHRGYSSQRLTISLEEAALLVPEALAQRLRQFAALNDEFYRKPNEEIVAFLLKENTLNDEKRKELEEYLLAIKDPRHRDIGLGFTYEEYLLKIKESPVRPRPNPQAGPKDESLVRPRPKSLWNAGYTDPLGRAGLANILIARYRLKPVESLNKMKNNALGTAQEYLEAGPVDRRAPAFPGTVGAAIILMLSAHELTGQDKYLDRAEDLAREAVELFLSDGCPLPKVTHMLDHYEAITGADTLMMSLLQLWAVRQQPPRSLSLKFCDY